MFLIAVLLLFNAVEYSSSERINIVPSPDSSCPGEFTGEPCFTLEQYSAYPNRRNTNITLDFHPGVHRLNSYLSVSNIYSFTMRANITSMVSVVCRQGVYNLLRFYQLQHIYVSNITFTGCMMYLSSITNATFVRSSLKDATTYGGALSTYDSSVYIKQCIVSNNSNGAILYGSWSNFVLLTIDESIFENNSYYNDGGAVHAVNTNYNQGSYNITILNSIFRNNRASRGGGAVYLSGGNITIINCSFVNSTAEGSGGAVHLNGGNAVKIIVNSVFINNTAITGSGGAVYNNDYRNDGNITIVNSTFENSTAEDGGALHLDSGNITIFNATFMNCAATAGGGAANLNGGNITIFNSKFMHNRASGGGGVLLVGGHHGHSYGSLNDHTTLLLAANLFSHNSASYCGVVKMIGLHHDYANFTGNTFTDNRAVDRVAGNNGGGVICTRNASVFILDNNFSHNSAAGDAGVIQADDSQVTIEGSIFSNNTAGGNGGALQTYFYPTNYTITSSSFTNNQAGGDGGAMYVGRAGCHVTIHESTFSDNYATERGGVISIVGSTLHLNRASVYENFARTGEIINSCYSNVTIINPIVLATQEPVVASLCAQYNDSLHTTVSPTTIYIQTTPVPTTEPLTQESTAESLDDNTTTDDATEDVTMTTTIVPQPDGTTEEDVTTSTKTTTLPQPDAVTSKEAAEETTHSDLLTDTETITMTTSQVDDQDNEQDTAQHNLHAIVPGYVAIGAVVVLLVLFALFGVVILVKMFKVNPPEPQKVNRLNFNTYEYPTMKNESALPDVHLVTT